jgi:arylsulfatase
MADDLGYQELGCYGQKKILTPNIDKLAFEGMMFTDYYTGSAVCAPARCSLLTGEHGGHAYVRDNHEIGGWNTFNGQLPLPKGTETLVSLLKKKGYTTGAFGKWGLGAVDSTGDPLEVGFDTFLGYNCQRHAHNLYPRYLYHDKKKLLLEGNTRGLTGRHYAPQIIADRMLDFLDENRDKPFFIYYPTVLPHLPLQAPQEEIGQYKGNWRETPYSGESYLPHPTPRACYAAMITFLDKQVGRLMNRLKKQGIDSNTIVFFTSDNGTTYLKQQVDYEFFESVGAFRGLKGSLHEGGIRVPMIARWPGKIKPGSITNHLSAHYDVMATLAELIDAKVPKDTDGVSFLPTLVSRSKEQQSHEYLFWDYAGYGGQLAVRMGKWKGIKKNLKSNPNAAIEIYDLENDPSEQNDVAWKNPEVAERIEAIMLQARTTPEIEQFQFGEYPEMARCLSK